MKIHKNFSLVRKVSIRVLTWIAVASIGTILFSSCAFLDKPSFGGKPADSYWPHENSDLSPDENLVFGRLDNGLRFVIQENQTPRDRVSMHLVVQVGSLEERPEEQGIAHFIEHMLFNGSVHFPPGEMVKFFQRIGMQFGPDANAHTGFTQTVYDVVLPRGDEKSLAEGLLVLRDYADGALLAPAEIARERKVVLAEMRSRDSAQFRTFKATLRFELPGLLISKRFPIGQAATLEKMDNRMLRKFYTTWYRPERMILVMVGDLDSDTAKKMVRERFADLKSQTPAVSPVDVGTMEHKGVKTFYHYETESGSTRVSIETVTQRSEPADSIARRRQEMVSHLADTMLQYRLDAMVQRPGSILTTADIDSGYYLRQIKFAQIGAECKPAEWPEALAEIEQALRKALAFGFTGAELLRARNDYKAQLLKAAQEERTRDSKALAQDIMAALDDWRVLQSPRQQVDILVPMLEDVTLENVNQALMFDWGADHRLVLVTGNADLSSNAKRPEEQILDAYSAANMVTVSPPVEKKAALFPYLPDPVSSGAIVSRRRIKDLGIEQIEFGNGFRLNLKATQFKQNEILAALVFGRGEASEPENQPGLSDMARDVINESGFGSMDRLDLETALAGRLAHTEFEIQEDMFIVNGEAIPAELPLLFQLMHAFIEDPGYREEARQLVLKRFQQDYQSMPHSVEGMLRLKGQKFLAGGDRRFGAPPWDQLQQRDLHQIKAWIGSQMDPATMELAVVGDFDAEKVIELAARYFGSLARRAPKDRRANQTIEPGPVFPSGRSLILPVATDIPKAMVVAAFPTDDFWDIQRTRRLTVLAELFSERLREHIREKLGAAYSPYAYNRSYRAYEGYGLTQILVQVDPHQVDEIINEIRYIADNLTAEESDADEFRRVLEPTLTYIKDLRQKNTYWLNSVLKGASRYPRQLDWSRSLESDYTSITAKEIFDLARRYLVQQNAATIILSPTKTAAKGQNDRIGD